MAGPFTFVPALACVMTMSLMAYPQFTGARGLLIVILALGFLVPIVAREPRPSSSDLRHGGGELITTPAPLFLAAPRTPSCSSRVGRHGRGRRHRRRAHLPGEPRRADPAGHPGLAPAPAAPGCQQRYMRGEIARRVNLKFAPEIRFRIDERFDQAERIEKLLRTPDVQRDLAGKKDE